MSFLAIDIGNTRLKWALYASPQPGAAVLAQGAVFLEKVEQLAEMEWQHLSPPHSILGCSVAGDAIRHRVEEQLFELWELVPGWVVSTAQGGGISNGYDHPGRLGADRFVAMVGARRHILSRGAARPGLVVMIGTAVTVDALDQNGHFLGGLILPGHGIMLRALEGGTAGLRVPTGEVREFPTNTSDALTSGGTYAITGAIERMHRHLSRHCAAHCALPPVTLMTGGAAWKVAPAMDVAHELVDSLIFDGMLELQAHRLAM